MARYSTSRKATAKARRKDDAARLTAHAQSRLGNAKARAVPVAGEDTAAAEPSPEPVRDYVARRHLRRDIGSELVVHDLRAADAPESAPKPFTDPAGVEMVFAVSCETHDASTYFAGFAQALRAAKASHTWCEGCSALLAGTEKVRSRARSQNARNRST